MPPRCPRGRMSRRLGPGGRGDLEPDLPADQHERSRDVEAVGEERPVARVGAPLGLRAADREDRLVGLAGEEVAAARAPVDQQAGAGGVVALDLRAVARRRARHQAPRPLLHPAEGRDVVVRAEQDAGLAGAGLRREVGLPLHQPVAVVGDPAGQGRRAAVAHGVPQDREGQPVDLEEHDARDVRPRRRALAPRDAARDAQVVLVVVVRAQHHLEDEAHGGHDDRGQERVAERVDPDVVGQQLVRQHQDGGVGQQQQHEPADEHQRQPQRGQERRQHRVDEGDDGRHQEGRARPSRVTPVSDRGRHPDRGRADRSRTRSAGRCRCAASPAPIAPARRSSWSANRTRLRRATHHPVWVNVR